MEFFEKWYGILAVAVFDVAALTLVVCLTYRWLFKRIFDFLVSSVCLIATSPFLLAAYLTTRKVEREEFVGKKGKKIALHSFGGKFGKLLRLWDIFCGRLSFVGGKPFTAADCVFLDEDEEDRLLAKPGLINPLAIGGTSETDYDEMIASDKKYAWSFSFFGDTKIFFAWFLKMIRGEGNGYLGVTRGVSYAKALLNEERITREDYDAAIKRE